MLGSFCFSHVVSLAKKCTKLELLVTMKRFFLCYFRMNIWIVLGVILLIYLAALTFEFRVIFTDEYYIQSFNEKASYEQIQDFIFADRQIEWQNYPYAFFRIIVPSFLIASVLFVGVILKDLKISFYKLFGVTVKAQIVFAINYVLAIIMKTVGWLDNSWESINNNYSYQSLLVFFKEVNLPYWLYYPLQSINITESLHVLLLSVGVQSISSLGFSKSLGLVLTFYGLGLSIWVIFTVFLQTII